MRIMMLDTEAFGLDPKSVVVQVAFCCHDLASNALLTPGTVSMICNTDEQTMRSCDPSTVKWWLKQSDHARRAVSVGTDMLTYRASDVHQVICKDIRNYGIDYVVAKPSTYDIPLLTSYFKDFGFTTPWNYRQVLDMQTLARLFDPTKELMPDGDPGREHDAAYDVEWQTAYMQILYDQALGHKR
jgi:hypothetical protein